jgi:hypothetical protein
MACLNKYSVYEQGTDKPIFIYGTAAECANSLGVSVGSFYKQIWRARNGMPPQKYQIYIENTDEEDCCG